MEENKVKLLFRVLVIIFICILFLLVLKAFGAFNFLYSGKLNNVLEKDIEIYNNFLDNKIDITKTISEDKIIQTSLIQYNYKSQFMDAFKHLTLYKQNYPEIRNITLFNSLYEIVLVSEINERIINKSLNKDWFLNAHTRGLFVSDISYTGRYNEHVVSVIFPIKNILDESIGYLLIDFSLSTLVEKFDRFPGTVVLIKKQNRFIFTHPLDRAIKNEYEVKQFKMAVSKNLDFDYRFYVAATGKFFALPLLVKIILIILTIIVLLFILYYSSEKYSKIIDAKTEKLKILTEEIIEFSRKIGRDNTAAKSVKEKKDNDGENKREEKSNRRDLKKIDKVRSKSHVSVENDEEGFMYIN